MQCVALKKAGARGSCYQKASINASRHRHRRSKTTCCSRAGALLPFSSLSKHSGSRVSWWLLPVLILAAARKEVLYSHNLLGVLNKIKCNKLSLKRFVQHNKQLITGSQKGLSWVVKYILCHAHGSCGLLCCVFMPVALRQAGSKHQGLAGMAASMSQCGWYKEPLCRLKGGEIINVKLLKPSFALELKEIQFLFKNRFDT